MVKQVRNPRTTLEDQFEAWTTVSCLGWRRTCVELNSIVPSVTFFPQLPIEVSCMSFPRMSLTLGRRSAVAVMAGLLVPALTLAQSTADLTEPRLRRAIAEADRLTPGWRMDELQANRLKPAPEKDSAAVLDQTAGQLSPPTDAERELVNNEVDSKQPLGAAVKKDLAALVERNRAVLPALRGLVDRPTGRFRFTMGKGVLDTLLPHLQILRQQVDVLLADALLRVDGGDADGALDSCRAAVCAARSLFDEPFAISQLVRIACMAKTQEAILAVLDRGRPSAVALAETQQVVADETEQVISRTAMLGERAMMFEVLGRLADGSLSLDKVIRDVNAKLSFDGPRDILSRPAVLRASQGLMLERMNLMVEAVRQPSWTWLEGNDRYDRSMRPARGADGKLNPEDALVVSLAPSLRHIIEGELRIDALGRALELLIAAERYALIGGDWPKSAEALVPRYLKAVPTDPLTGKPMRLVRERDRLIAYSLGVNGRDDGGKVDGSSDVKVKESADVGFALPIPRPR